MTRREATAKLLEMVQPGDTVYTVLRHVSRSRMMRHISTFVMRENQPVDITWLVALVLEWRRNDRDGGLVVRGVGMDMGFYVVLWVGQALYANGYKLNHRWI